VWVPSIGGRGKAREGSANFPLKKSCASAYGRRCSLCIGAPRGTAPPWGVTLFIQLDWGGVLQLRVGSVWVPSGSAVGAPCRLRGGSVCRSRVFYTGQQHDIERIAPAAPLPLGAKLRLRLAGPVCTLVFPSWCPHRSFSRSET
jgi:hypothetical protein